MRFLLPSLKVRTLIREELRQFFKTEKDEHFDTALHALCGFYEVAVPKIVWVEKFEDSSIAGLCSERGVIHLIPPGRWKRNRKHNGMRQWREIVLHEIGHLLFYSNGEEKADLFAKRVLSSK